MKKLLTILILLSFSICNIYSQNKIIKGRVISDDLEYLPRAFIIINDSIEVGKTDLKGYFKIDVPAHIKKIKFMYVGLYTANIQLVDNCEEVEVVMMRSETDDFFSLKRAEMKKKKRFKKIPKIHKQAFEKGIFEIKEPCYEREFEPYYLDDD